MIYFDHASTTPVCPEVQTTYQRVLEKYYANSESLYPSGREAEQLMEKSRRQTADFLGVGANEIIFTASGSEANNLAIKGTALKRQRYGRHIITSIGEHSSVVNSCRWLEEYLGFEVTWLPLNREGSVDVADLKKAIRDDTILVSLMYVNNETGAFNPMAEIRDVVRRHHNCYLHTDCVQALGKCPVDLNGVEMASFSAHKIYGLKGSGFLVKKAYADIAPLISGGQQEGRLRGGTANTPANIVMGRTVRLAFERMNEGSERVQQLRQQLWEGLKKLDHVVINSPASSSPFVTNFSCLKLTSQVMMNALALKGFEVSAQSTCDSADAYSRVIAGMYNEPDRLKGTIRVSIGYETTKEEIDQLLAAIRESIEKYG